MTLHQHFPSEPPLGPVIVDIAGTALTEEECRVLRHPLVGGVILFSRNYSAPEQLMELTAAIHALRQPPLLIAVDHEGGRVQRFRTGFTVLPPMRLLGELWDVDQERALDTARAAGYVLASELRAHGVDLSFTPVLDLDYGTSSVIGSRAFHARPAVAAALAQALVAGLSEAGMGSVGKHFPGHGFVAADSHIAIPVDERSFAEIWEADLQPYRHPLGRHLSAVMPAHVIYPKCDPKPAGFSRFWLREVLRRRLGFEGLVFSDDLSMEGAKFAGDIVQRATAALDAGCDMILVCNAPDAARYLLANWQPRLEEASQPRILRMLREDAAPDPFELALLPQYAAAKERVAELSVA